MKNSRRNFIKSISLLSAYTSLPLSLKAYAQNIDELLDHFFVQILVDGGMDVTLSLDPKSHTEHQTSQKDIFLEYRPDQIIKKGGLSLGPACEALKKHMSDIAVINGIVMRRDVGHETLLNYISSGSGANTEATCALEVSQHLSSTVLGTLVNESILTGGYLPKVFQLSSNFFSSEGGALKKSEADFYKSVFQGNVLSDKSLSMLELNSVKAKINKAYEKVAALNEISNEQFKNMASSFLTNASNTAVLSLGSAAEGFDLDTHSNHEGRHLGAQGQVWSTISELFESFKSIPYKKGSLFDHTTFMVCSEFSRTPYLNAARGKDHNVYTNSILLAGKNIKGESSFGASHVIKGSERLDGKSLHIGRGYDYKLGMVGGNKRTSDMGLIFPENALKSLHSIFNVPSKDFYKGLGALPTIKGLRKS